MSEKNILKLFEEEASSEIVEFGCKDLKHPNNGMKTQYDWAYFIAISANHKTEYDVVSNIIDLLDSVKPQKEPKKQNIVNEKLMKIVVAVVVVLGIGGLVLLGLRMLWA